MVVPSLRATSGSLWFCQNPDESLVDSVVEAGRRRIRPMALKTVTSIIGIVPLVSNTSFQAQVLVPMGVSLVFGLAASTIIGLFIVPVLYYLLAQVIPPRHHDELKDSYEFPQNPSNPTSSEFGNGVNGRHHDDPNGSNHEVGSHHANGLQVGRASRPTVHD